MVTEPFNAISGLFEQSSVPIPASTVGSGVMVIVIRSVTAKQSPFPVVVKVRVTVPAAISAAVGVYVAPRVVVFGLKEPKPPDQIPPVAVVTDPFRVTAAALAQTV